MSFTFLVHPHRMLHYILSLGPAFDGGYYLVGATKLHQHLFRGVHWSTEQVYQRTEENAKAFGLKVSERTQLPT